MPSALTVGKLPRAGRTGPGGVGQLTAVRQHLLSCGYIFGRNRPRAQQAPAWSMHHASTAML